MDVFDAIRTRRTIRKYKVDPVEKEKLFNIFGVAGLAPSAMNRQPYILIVVTEPKVEEKISSACNQNWVALVIVVKRILGLPSEVRVLAMTSLGYLAEMKGAVTI